MTRNFNAQRFRDLWGADLTPSSSLIPRGMRGFRAPIEEGSTGKRFVSGCSRPLTISVIDGIPLRAKLRTALETEVAHAYGCQVEVRFLEMGRWVQDFAAAKSDLYFCGLDPNSLDPLGYYRFFITGASDNFLGYNDRELTRRFNDLYRKLPIERSSEEYQFLQSSFERSGFGVPIGSPNVVFLYAKNVQQVHINPIGMLLNRWWEIGRRSVSR